MKTALRAILCLPLLLAHTLNSFGQSPTAVATVAGQPVSEQELLETLGPQQLMQMRTQEYETKSKALESLIRLKVVQAEAKKAGLSAEKLIEQEVDSKTANPTDGEVEAAGRAGASLFPRTEPGGRPFRLGEREISSDSESA